VYGKPFLTEHRRQLDGTNTAPARSIDGNSTVQHEQILIQSRRQFRSISREPICMSKEQRERIKATMKARAYPRNSHLYRWLRDNRRFVEDAFKATGAGWDGLLAVVLEAGITGRYGTPPNERSVRKVWLRVCSDIETEAASRSAAKAGKPVPHRSRERGDWRPPVAAAPRARTDPPREEPPSRQPHVAPAPQSSPSDTGSSELDDLPPEVKAKFDRLRQDFAETDRKRFGRF
jgi:hypothetical protein